MDPLVLRKKYPKFVYERYSHKISGNNLEIFFDFSIEPGIRFRPGLVIRNVSRKKAERIGEKGLDNLVFNLGMIEILSYWKATCSREISVEAGYLDEKQIRWWKELIIKGMGQFFFENKVDFRKPDFLEIKSRGNKKHYPIRMSLAERFLVPIGGGKDSVVTLEILKNAKKDIACFCLNPIDLDKKIMDIAGCKNQIIAERKIDKRLLELNRKGFLNGHTPFSAYLAFLCSLIADIFDYRHMALSNERSANEGNVKYLGSEINHQWSKSFEFEQMFRGYSKKYLNSSLDYFSFLRPLYELQIARIFSDYPKYFPVFLSCNEALKTDSCKKKPSKKWCGKCSKCLFAFAILYPFLKEKDLVGIFKKNLFNDKALVPLMEELIGERNFKPFECLGTTKESLVAFYMGWQKAKKSGEMPFLLKHLEDNILKKHPELETESRQILFSLDKKNNLPRGLEKLLTY
ncbi:MAG: hypothetical protein E4H47_01125 [Parcubacteria group bacterium]|nr:MAG: hypothetical protein E4H47_01125 [Parcubacteria group bacterium]